MKKLILFFMCLSSLIPSKTFTLTDYYKKRVAHRRETLGALADTYPLEGLTPPVENRLRYLQKLHIEYVDLLADLDILLKELNNSEESDRHVIIANLLGSKRFCEWDYPTERSIDDPTVQEKDHEGFIPLIKKYSPIMYLQKGERYFPVSAPEYFANPATQVVFQKDHQKKERGEKHIIIPAGEVTMEKLNDLSNQNTTLGKEVQNLFTEYDASYGDLFIENVPCVQWGSNPDLHKEDDGETFLFPAYVITAFDEEQIQLQFIFLYGFNGPFKVGGFVKVGAHECDIEHITIILDTKTRTPQKIFYSAHGTEQGQTHIFGDKNMIMEEETHPTVYPAIGSHGCYSRIGTYCRLGGVANDVTDDPKYQWKPTLIRLYKPNDPRFEPASMGWSSFKGDCGPRGVQGLGGKKWFGVIETPDKGKFAPYFCQAPRKSKASKKQSWWKKITRIIAKGWDKTKYTSCIIRNSARSIGRIPT